MDQRKSIGFVPMKKKTQYKIKTNSPALLLPLPQRKEKDVDVCIFCIYIIKNMFNFHVYNIINIDPRLITMGNAH